MKKSRKKIRYAVVGLGHIAQVAVLPAFKHAKRNSELAALVTGDPEKDKKLGEKYAVKTYGYEEYDVLLKSDEIDAVFIALPNHLHAEYTIKAARAGKHILCEKPMAATEKECRAMIEAAKRRRVKLMIAYRLHFEESNMDTLRLVKSGKIGEPRIFNSVFTMQVRSDNIRIDREKGGGTLPDIGIYCINAARYLFQAEPLEVFAFSSGRNKGRFKEVDEMSTAVLRFPEDRFASFTSSFGASPVAAYQIVGTKGDIRLEQAYEYVGERQQYLTVNEKTQKRTFKAADQFSAELLYFSECILKNRKPEPSGLQGLADIHIIEALYQSAKKKRPIKIKGIKQPSYPHEAQTIVRPGVRKPDLVRVKSASQN